MRLAPRFKADWHEIGGKRKYYRSNWEFQYAKYLELLKNQGLIKDWEHEPQTFWFEKIKRGVRSYKPDFKVTLLDERHYWVEVKGYYDQRSRTTIKRFNKYYPKETLIVVDSTWFKKAI